MLDPKPNDETLLGFLLGALDPTETQVVLEALERDLALRERLAHLSDLLGPFQQEMGHRSLTPPSWLLDRVLADIAIGKTEADCEAEEVRPEPSSSLNERLGWQMGDSSREINGLSSRRWIDLLVGTAACLVFVSLLIPGTFATRKLAQRETCAHNLAGLGMSFSAYSNSDPARRIPSIELMGPMSFSGVYAIRLNDRGMLEHPEQLWCPSISQVMKHRNLLISSERLQECDSDTAECCRRMAGGSYAFNLGIVENGNYITPQWNGQTYFAILADAPMLRPDGYRWYAHGGRGINILFDDGHVSFVRFTGEFDAIDNPYYNRDGKRAAGLDRDDSALGPSPLPPFPSLRTAPLNSLHTM